MICEIGGENIVICEEKGGKSLNFSKKFFFLSVRNFLEFGEGKSIRGKGGIG